MSGPPRRAGGAYLAALFFALHASAAEADQAAGLDLVEVAPPPAAMGEEAPDEGEALALARDLGSGVASYYGNRFAGKPTASGELFDPAALTAAHRNLPFGSRVLVTSARTGQSVIVTINDRGPFHGGRIIDLSHAAANRIGLVRQGRGPVKLALLAE